MMFTGMAGSATRSQRELNLSGIPDPIVVGAPTQCRHKPGIVISLLLAGFLMLECFVPLGTIVQVGADEGFELAKATLCLTGHHLYSEVWNDQPPLHTFLITQILKHISSSILGPRLLTVAFSLLLLSAVFAITLRASGLWVAGIATAMVIASPGFVELGSSCMLEIPALAMATAGLSLALIGRDTKWFVWEARSGTLFGLGLQMKLVPVIYLPLVPLIFFLRRPCEKRAMKSLVGQLAVFSAGLGLAFAGTDLLIEHGTYLVHFQQSWTSHFAPARSVEYGSAGQHPFEWSILLKNWDVTAPAVVGLVVLFVGMRNGSLSLLPLAWLALTFLVFGLHKPWWPYYYIHTAIPLCWCAGIGVGFLIEKARGRLKVVPIAALGLFGVCALSWMGARLYLQVTNLRHAPQTYSSPVIAQMKRFKPVTEWLYSDKLIYSFHSEIPMVPSLAVVPIKRMWAGDMTNARLTQELVKHKPGLLALLNDGRDVPFKDLLDTDYQLVYMDKENRLYALRSIARKGKLPEQ
jgi:4-amino-4-deoxy-L-arabinose transferase-like glycosyltransferase